jgi:hypothetical protein
MMVFRRNGGSLVSARKIVHRVIGPSSHQKTKGDENTPPSKG